MIWPAHWLSGNPNPAFDGEASVLETLGVWSTFPLSLLSDPLWQWVGGDLLKRSIWPIYGTLTGVVPVRVPYMGQIDFLKVIHIWKDCVQKETLKKQLLKKCKYEHTMNVLP